MKKSLFLIICILFAKNLFAQFDTTTAIYDFNSLSNGNLNGQDNWVTTKWSTNIDIQVADTGYDGTKALYFNQVGPGVGCDASKALDTIGFPGFSFTPNGTYILSFDIKRNYWGLDFGFAADLNGDGKVTKNDANEKALIFRAGNSFGEKMLLPNGTTFSYNAGINAWTTYEITLSQMNTIAGGLVGVRLKQLGSSTWTVVASNLNAGIDTTVATKQNPLLWNMMFMHYEGSFGELDNIRITKITPSSTTGISSQNTENSVLIYPNPVVNELTVKSDNNQQLDFKLYDITLRKVLSKTFSNSTIINLEQFKSGVYLYEIVNKEGMIKQGKIVKG
ncbi:MAG: T9SS type A sorting domain-containing protein [Bacteroidetes bacterium]|nr:T9SS type A sorting domain-containing protein [Bacteroidota bacterium]